MMRKFLLGIVILFILTGCAKHLGVVSSSKKESKFTTVNEILGGEPKDLQIVEKNFTIKDLQSISSHPEITNVRLIRLTRPASLQLIPEYRLLDMTKDGPYAMLGFEPGDIVIGCHGIVLNSPTQFFKYVKSLPFLDDPSFNIIRKNRHMKIKIKKIQDDSQ